ncbi:MAG: hypothetical protein JNM12_14335 [Alphaproteobacteria bacterium]|nr:hypothetical protein [Alphaproteobacteria bacterium]
MTEPQRTPRDIINKYSPIVKGRTGLSSLVFKAAARTAEIAQNAAHAVSEWAYPKGIENSAGQLLTNTAPVIAETFARMESKLAASFNTASAKNADAQARDNFLQLADEVKADAKIIAPLASVLRAEFDIVTEPYTFIVAQGVTLEQGIAQVTAANARTNPVTIRRHPAAQPQPAKAVGL